MSNSIQSIKKAGIEKAKASLTKANVEQTIKYLAAMNAAPNFGRYSITDGVSVYGASQVVRTMVELHGVNLLDCGLQLPVIVALLNEIGVPVTDRGSRKDLAKAAAKAAKASASETAAPVPVSVPVSGPVSVPQAASTAAPDLVLALSSIGEAMQAIVKKFG